MDFRVTITSAALALTLPLIVFVLLLARGIMLPTVLWFSIVQVYYTVRLVDMEMVARPSWKTTWILSIAFLTISVTFNVISLFTPADPLTEKYLTAGLTFGFFLLYGERALMINNERATALQKEHPMMFFETRTTGYYNIAASYFLAGLTAVGDLSKASALQDILFFGYVSIFLYSIAVVFIVYLLRSHRQMEQLKKTKEGRKLLIRAAEDSWDQVVGKQSAFCKLLANLLVPLSIGSLYVGIFGLWMAIDNSSFLVPGLFTVAWAGTIFSYSQRRAGLSVSGLLRVARGSMDKARSIEELRRLARALSSYCWAAAGLTVALGQLIASEHNLSILDMTRTVFMPFVVIYFEVFILLMIGVLAQWTRWHGLPENASLQYRRRASKMLNSGMTVFYVMTGCITGSAAYALRIPMVIDAILGAAWVVTSLVLQYYLAYLKGGEGFEQYWRAAKRSAAIKM